MNKCTDYSWQEEAIGLDQSCERAIGGVLLQRSLSSKNEEKLSPVEENSLKTVRKALEVVFEVFD